MSMGNCMGLSKSFRINIMQKFLKLPDSCSFSVQGLGCFRPNAIEITTPM